MTNPETIGLHLLVSAQTGYGKTPGFGLCGCGWDLGRTRIASGEVSTPGRLRGHIMRNSIDLSGLKAVPCKPCATGVCGRVWPQMWPHGAQRYFCIGRTAGSTPQSGPVAGLGKSSRKKNQTRKAAGKQGGMGKPTAKNKRP